MKNGIILTIAIASLFACQQGAESESASNEQASLYQQAPPVTAAQLAEEGSYGPGHEVHLLYDSLGQVHGTVEIIHSPRFIFLDFSPSAPWLATYAAADAWLVPPAELDPTTYVARREFTEGVATASLWLPMPYSVDPYGDTTFARGDTIYIAVEGISTGGSLNCGTALLPFWINPYTSVQDPVFPFDTETSSSSSAVFTDISSSSATFPPSHGGVSADTASSSSQTNPTSSAADSSAIDDHTDTVSISTDERHWDLCGKIADGRTIGFWKNNISKYLAGVTKGIQIPAEDMKVYLSLLPIEAKAALDILENRSSEPRALLAKQLLGARLNQARGAFIDGDADFTREFINWGITLLASDSVTDVQLLAAKDLFDAYNNSHGGRIGMECYF